MAVVLLKATRIEITILQLNQANQIILHQIYIQLLIMHLIHSLNAIYMDNVHGMHGDELMKY